jgi:hypothetical protein
MLEGLQATGLRSQSGFSKECYSEAGQEMDNYRRGIASTVWAFTANQWSGYYILYNTAGGH